MKRSGIGAVGECGEEKQTDTVRRDCHNEAYVELKSCACGKNQVEF